MRATMDMTREAIEKMSLVGGERGERVSFSLVVGGMPEEEFVKRLGGRGSRGTRMGREGGRGRAPRREHDECECEGEGGTLRRGCDWVGEKGRRGSCGTGERGGEGETEEEKDDQWCEKRERLHVWCVPASSDSPSILRVT